jgi:hypothetical protein
MAQEGLDPRRYPHHGRAQSAFHKLRALLGRPVQRADAPDSSGKLGLGERLLRLRMV